MSDVPATHRGGRIHGVRVGQSYAGVALRIEQLPQLRLLAVIRAGGVAWRRADAAVFLAYQLLVGEGLVCRVTPQLAPHALVEVLGGGFRESIGERLEHDGGVVVVSALEARD